MLSCPGTCLHFNWGLGGSTVFKPLEQLQCESLGHCHRVSGEMIHILCPLTPLTPSDPLPPSCPDREGRWRTRWIWGIWGLHTCREALVSSHLWLHRSQVPLSSGYTPCGGCRCCPVLEYWVQRRGPRAIQWWRKQGHGKSHC
jgi:hypothetical protein